MITQHRAPLLHHLQVVGVVNPALVFGVEGGLQQVFADHGFAAHTKGLQIHLIANQQASLAVAHIDRVRRAVDQGAHERQLVIEGTLGLIAFLHQPPQIRNPHHPHGQHAQQHQRHFDHRRAIAYPVTIVQHHSALPAVGQGVHFLGGDTGQCFAQNRVQLVRVGVDGQCELGRGDPDGAADAQASAVLLLDQITGTDQ